jgi:hypothetical protein
MLSVVSEGASEGMHFFEICVPSRFHTAKTTTDSGHLCEKLRGYGRSAVTSSLGRINIECRPALSCNPGTTVLFLFGLRGFPS